MKNQIKKWKSKSLFSKIGDIFFVVLVVLLLIPVSRTVILAGVNNLKARVIAPKTEKKIIATLSDADYNWQLLDIDGNPVNFSEFKGKVIFVNFWATWCGPCVGEMPELQDFYNNFKNNKDVVFILASNDNLDVIKNFMNKKQYSFPVYSIKSTPPNTMSHSTIPTSYLIDKKGNIVLHQKGVANWGGNKMKDLVNQFLE